MWNEPERVMFKIGVNYKIAFKYIGSEFNYLQLVTYQRGFYSFKLVWIKFELSCLFCLELLWNEWLNV